MPIGWFFCHWFLLQCKRTGVGSSASAGAMPNGAIHGSKARWRVIPSQARY
ncbi:hypothetical protein CDS [Bradyrhizobium sp.]|nr:hypothetical protein CDS [Bradyrhizobium sp.]